MIKEEYDKLSDEEKAKYDRKEKIKIALIVTPVVISAILTAIDMIIGGLHIDCSDKIHIGLLCPMFVCWWFSILTLWLI